MEWSIRGALIVGVDGSAASLAALRWASAQARLLGAPLAVVHAWAPTAPLRAPYAPVTGQASVEQDRRRAAELLQASVAWLLASDPDAHVRPLLDEGMPATVLLRHARHACLLALGRKPQEDVALPALGSVARECIRHAMCPVVTVPESPAPGAGIPWLAEHVAAGAGRF
ncbi:universal stress protein [Streptomyces sp. HUAS TT7]|uniref:universal stress protein n=1 Tax=Streptomyces sp. HUAS TT7 TaxID=3447507 RepID=UPI003F65A355